jgi:hypothetical protein
MKLLTSGDVLKFQTFFWGYLLFPSQNANDIIFSSVRTWGKVFILDIFLFLKALETLVDEYEIITLFPDPNK